MPRHVSSQLGVSVRWKERRTSGCAAIRKYGSKSSSRNWRRSRRSVSSSRGKIPGASVSGLAPPEPDERGQPQGARPARETASTTRSRDRAPRTVQSNPGHRRAHRRCRRTATGAPLSPPRPQTASGVRHRRDRASRRGCAGAPCPRRTATGTCPRHHRGTHRTSSASGRWCRRRRNPLTARSVRR